MDIEPVWYPYATFDDDGFVNGIKEDAPDEMKEAYNEYVKEKERIIQSGEMLPK